MINCSYTSDNWLLHNFRYQLLRIQTPYSKIRSAAEKYIKIHTNVPFHYLYRNYTHCMFETGEPRRILANYHFYLRLRPQVGSQTTISLTR